jgi:hypothetical protein
MNIRYLTVNNRRFKIERYLNHSGKYTYAVYKYFNDHPRFESYKWICNCSLDTLMETLRNYE